MIVWSALTLSVALVAGLFGFGGTATQLSELAQFLFFASIGVFAIIVIAGNLKRREKGS